MNRNDILKFIDVFFGKIICHVVSQPCQRSEQTGKILVIRPGGIGDAVLLSPMLSLLHQHYPENAIDVLAERRNSSVFKLIPGIRKVFCYDRLGDLATVLRGKYDTVIDTEQWHRLSAIIARLAATSRVIGFATNERRRMLTDRVLYAQDSYETVNFTNLLSPLGITAAPGVPPPSLTLSVPAAQVTFTLLGTGSMTPYVVLFPGASISERRWGGAHYRHLAEFLKSKGLGVVVVGGRDDVLVGEEIVTGNLGINLAGKTTLVETAAIIAKSRLLVSGDSGILHIAVGLAVPTVSLFGPGIEQKWAPRGDNHVVINHHLPCSPCTRFGYTPNCPISTKCMRDISVAEVAAGCMQLLEGDTDQVQVSGDSPENRGE